MIDNFFSSMRGERFRLAVLALSVLALVSCSSPEDKKRRHVERGDQYVSEKRDEFAAVEYTNAIRIDPAYGEAHLKLAETYERMRNLPQAFRSYIRAADALPDNRDLQIKATELLLATGGFEEAKARAAKVLAKNPRDIDGLVLHANALAALRDPEGAVKQIEEALKVNPGDSRVLLNLGNLRMEAGDAAAAEAAFGKAISLAPSSVEPRLALANFLWAANRPEESEATLKEALAQNPRHVLANRMLGILYLATKRRAEAEQPIKVVAEESNTPESRFQLADYYITMRRPKDAMAILTRLREEPAQANEADVRLAALDYALSGAQAAHARLDSVIARAATYAPALVLKSQWLVAENKLDAALDHAKRAIAADPQSVQAHFVLGAIHDRRLESADAATAYNEVLRLNPRAIAAQVELSRLNLGKGDGSVALRYAEEARQLEPQNPTARVALARSLLVANNLTRAETEIAGLMKANPNVGVVHSLQGTLLASRRNNAAARASFERALELSPNLLEAVAGLTYLDLAANDHAAALARLEAQRATEPNDARVLGLIARVHASAKNPTKAEEALRRAVAVDPRFTNGYAMLAQLYMQQGRLDQARAEFEGMAKRNPSAVGAQTMVGVLLEVQGQRDAARTWYERTVAATDDAPVAANNLAFMYASEGTNLDQALQLASSAKRRLPDDPDVDDTIGWVYYKKGLHSLAVKPLEESLKKRPDNADVLVHLGLTYAKLGQNAKARQALGRAIQLDPNAGGDEVRRVLASLTE